MGNKVVKLSLTSEELLNKVFNGAVRGYDSFEVDSFLDRILSDYRLIESNYLMAAEDIAALNKRVETLIKENEQLQISNESYKAKLGNIKDSKAVNKDNITLYKKIDRLERFIYKMGYDPNKI